MGLISKLTGKSDVDKKQREDHKGSEHTGEHHSSTAGPGHTDQHKSDAHVPRVVHAFADATHGATTRGETHGKVEGTVAEHVGKEKVKGPVVVPGPVYVEDTRGCKQEGGVKVDGEGGIAVIPGGHATHSGAAGSTAGGAATGNDAKSGAMLV